MWIPNAGGQAAFVDDYEHYCCAAIGGRDSGKTFSGARKLIDIHIINSFHGGNLTGADSLIVAPTFSVANTVDIPEVVRAIIEAGLSYNFSADKSKYWFEIPELSTPTDPSRIYVRTAESPESIIGFSAPNVWGDEPAVWRADRENPIRDARSQIYGRMRESPREGLITQLNLTGTHEGDRTWLYEEFEESNLETHKMYRLPTRENPHARDFVNQQLKVLSEDQARQYIDGLAMHIGEGICFPMFDKAVHVQPTPYSPNLPIYWCLDFNVSPFCTGVCQHDHGEVQVIAEIEKADNATTAEMCSIFFSTAEERGWNLELLTIVGDPSGDHRETSQDKNRTDWKIVRNALDAKGINYRWIVPLSHASILSTVNAVRAKLKSADGLTHVSIDPSCKGLIGDLLRSEWPSDLQENHRLAWFRYFINREWPIRLDQGKRKSFGAVGFEKGFIPAAAVRR